MPEAPAIAELRDRRIALLGLGLENRALARFLLSRGFTFSVCDGKAPDDLESLREEFAAAVQEWRLGADYLDGLERFQLLFRTPGISPLRPELRLARAQGVHISSQTRLFAELSPAPLLGATGTKGKGTTISIIAEILRDGPCRQVYSAGNIGLPPIAFLDELSDRDLVLLELSSFQLQDWEMSPHIALVLNVTCDHLDYHADVDEYVEAKRAISRYQTAGDYLIVDQDCPRSRRFADDSPARLLSFSAVEQVESGAWAANGRLWLRRPGSPPEQLCALSDIPLRGRHNWGNAAAAATAAAVAGASTDQIAAGLKRFKGLEHRLERVGEYGGVTYYDDSLATTPDACIAAVESFDEPLILIAGGSSKGADFDRLGRVIVDRGVKAVVLLGEETARITAAIDHAGRFTGETIAGCQSMAAAVAAAQRLAQTGDVILLSPACASFGMFANYSDRGKQFKRAIQEVDDH